MTGFRVAGLGFKIALVALILRISRTLCPL